MVTRVSPGTDWRLHSSCADDPRLAPSRTRLSGRASSPSSTPRSGTGPLFEGQSPCALAGCRHRHWPSPRPVPALDHQLQSHCRQCGGCPGLGDLSLVRYLKGLTVRLVCLVCPPGRAWQLGGDLPQPHRGGRALHQDISLGYWSQVSSQLHSILRTSPPQSGTRCPKQILGR